ncbi:MAG TPA: alpha/beta hydrolase domain-containing protein, partial [Streptosporangiaceae bacterium]|nr:alpha/beta hydrolase domain-containing protein [Streptosporangiaceae bacterium]
MNGSARLTGPVAGQPGIILAGFDLAQVGYTLEEFFLEGTATSFELTGLAGADGYWDVTPSGEAPFATRLVVCRPADPAAFTRTVVLEWLNVSAGFDAPAYWMLTHRHLIRSGWAWIGVSAQRAGIEGGSIFDSDGEASGAAPRARGEEPGPARRARPMLPALKESDPARYGALHHPGDAFCFDIFTQAARAVREGGVL